MLVHPFHCGPICKKGNTENLTIPERHKLARVGKVPSVTEDVNKDVPSKLLSVSPSQAGGPNYRIRVGTIDMNHRYANGFRDITAVA